MSCTTLNNSHVKWPKSIETGFIFNRAFFLISIGIIVLVIWNAFASWHKCRLWIVGVKESLDQHGFEVVNYVKDLKNIYIVLLSA